MTIGHLYLLQPVENDLARTLSLRRTKTGGAPLRPLILN